jgi:hypothetical protein
VKDGRAGELVARKLKKLKGANAAISKLKLEVDHSRYGSSGAYRTVTNEACQGCKKMDLDALKRKGEEVEKNTRVIPFQEDRVI